MTADKICILLLALTCAIQTLWFHRLSRKLNDLVEDWEGDE